MSKCTNCALYNKSLKGCLLGIADFICVTENYGTFIDKSDKDSKVKILIVCEDDDPVYKESLALFQSMNNVEVIDMVKDARDVKEISPLEANASLQNKTLAFFSDAAFEKSRSLVILSIVGAKFHLVSHEKITELVPNSFYRALLYECVCEKIPILSLQSNLEFFSQISNLTKLTT